jgi:hypothetical protein
MAYYPQSTTGLSYISYPAGPTAGGANLTGGVANTKGTYVEYVASSPFLTNRVTCVALNANDGTAAQSFLFDIATGAAASEVVVLPNIMVSQGNGQNTAGVFPFNLAIAASTRIAGRAQCTNASKAVDVGVMLQAAGGVVGVSSYTNYGSATADSGGVQVDPGGTANVKGAYAQISASTSAIIQHLIVMTGVGSNNLPVTALWDIDLATGAAASEVVLIPDIFASALSPGTNLGNSRQNALEFLTYIAASTRLAARASCSINDATDRLFDIALLTATAPAESGGEHSVVFG